MPRARNDATAETVEQPNNTEQINEWKAKAHTDGDLRIPKELRAKLGITGHSVWAITIVAEDESCFTLCFRKTA